jgi:hypothetical protein
MEIINYKSYDILEERENIFLAFDISTSRIGVAMFNKEYKLINIKALVLNKMKDIDADPEIIKGDAFKIFVESLKNYKIIDIFIEEPLVKSNNVYTVNKLLRFNGICSYILRDVTGIIPKFITVDDVRRNFCPEMTEFDKKTQKYILKFKSKKIDPKNYIFEKVSKLYKNINWTYNKNNKIKDENYDVSDAIALGLIGFKKFYEKEA